MTDITPVSTPLKLTINPVQQAAPEAAAPAATFWSGEAPGFSDLVDMVNPLQQLPIVGDIYRAMTGSTISTGARLAGGTLYGGPFGFIAALFNVIVEGESGKDIAGNVVALATGEKSFDFANNTSDGAPSPTNRSAYIAYEQAQSLLA